MRSFSYDSVFSQQLRIRAVRAVRLQPVPIPVQVRWRFLREKGLVLMVEVTIEIPTAGPGRVKHGSASILFLRNGGNTLSFSN